MKKLLLAILALLGTAATPMDSLTDYNTHLMEVQTYIKYCHRYYGKWVQPKVARIQNTIAPVVVTRSLEHGVDPLLTAVIIYYESSWVPGARGARGELGLMQVMAPRFKPKTLDDEIFLGTEKLQNAVNTCPTVLGALTYYASGKSCTAQTERTKRQMAYRFKKYLEAIKVCRTQKIITS